MRSFDSIVERESYLSRCVSLASMSTHHLLMYMGPSTASSKGNLPFLGKRPDRSPPDAHLRGTMSKHPILVRACQTNIKSLTSYPVELGLTVSCITQHKACSLADVATAQIIGTVQVCMSTALKGAKLIYIHGGSRLCMWPSVLWAVAYTRPCHARPARRRRPGPCEQN